MADNVPIVAPNPFVIIMNNPCALDLMFGVVILSTYRPPDTLKKSKAIPYTIHDSRNIHSPPSGLPAPKIRNGKPTRTSTSA